MRQEGTYVRNQHSAYGSAVPTLKSWAGRETKVMSALLDKNRLVGGEGGGPAASLSLPHSKSTANLRIGGDPAIISDGWARP